MKDDKYAASLDGHQYGLAEYSSVRELIEEIKEVIHTYLEENIVGSGLNLFNDWLFNTDLDKENKVVVHIGKVEYAKIPDHIGEVVIDYLDEHYHELYGDFCGTYDITYFDEEDRQELNKLIKDWLVENNKTPNAFLVPHSAEFTFYTRNNRVCKIMKGNKEVI